MRILYLQKEGGLFGAEQFHLRTIPALLNRGIEIEFLRLYTSFQLGANSLFVRRLQDLGVKVFEVNIGRFPGLRDLLRVNEIIREGDYDLVHTHLIHGDFYGAVIKKYFQKDIRLVSTKHGYDESYTNMYGFHPLLRRNNLYYRVCRFSETEMIRSFAISEGLRNFFVGSGISKEGSIDRIHYGFEMVSGLTEPDVSEFRRSDHQLVLAGRLVGFKGHRYAFEAVSLLKGKYPGMKLLVIGIGELESKLKKMVTDMGIADQVEFLGFKNNIQDYMHHSDVVLIPSIAEGFGIVFLEAVNQERPIAAFDVAAGNEILGSDYAPWMARPFDVQDYAGKIDVMLGNPGIMKEPILKAKERLLSYFTIDRMVDEMISFYKRAM